MRRLSVIGVLIMAAMTVISISPARAGVPHDKLAYIAFSSPVQVPCVTLRAGTYRFRLANPETNRHVLQILSADGSTVLAIFHTTPNSRAWISDDPIVTLRETEERLPPAVRSLSYGGESTGYEFVYTPATAKRPPDRGPYHR